MAVQLVEPDVDGRSVVGARGGWPFSRWSPTWMAVQSVEPVVNGRSKGLSCMAVESVEPEVDGR